MYCRCIAHVLLRGESEGGWDPCGGGRPIDAKSCLLLFSPGFLALFAQNCPFPHGLFDYGCPLECKNSILWRPAFKKTWVCLHFLQTSINLAMGFLTMHAHWSVKTAYFGDLPSKNPWVFLHFLQTSINLSMVCFYYGCPLECKNSILWRPAFKKPMGLLHFLQTSINLSMVFCTFGSKL